MLSRVLSCKKKQILGCSAKVGRHHYQSESSVIKAISVYTSYPSDGILLLDGYQSFVEDLHVTCQDITTRTSIVSQQDIYKEKSSKVVQVIDFRTKLYSD